MIVRYPGAGSVAAVLLGASGNIIRLAMDGWDDVAEFRLVNGEWLSEDNETVDIDSKPEPRWAEKSRGIMRPLFQALTAVVMQAQAN